MQALKRYYIRLSFSVLVLDSKISTVLYITKPPRLASLFLLSIASLLILYLSPSLSFLLILRYLSPILLYRAYLEKPYLLAQKAVQRQQLTDCIVGTAPIQYVRAIHPREETRKVTIIRMQLVNVIERKSTIASSVIRLIVSLAT